VKEELGRARFCRFNDVTDGQVIRTQAGGNFPGVQAEFA